MKYALCLLAILATAHAAADLTPGLLARYGSGGQKEYNTTAFFEIPKTVEEALSFGWKQTARPPGPLGELVMYCHPTPTICTLHDDCGHIAGMQVALIKSLVTDQILDWTTQGFVSWTTDDGTEYWTQHLFFVNEDYLAMSKEERMAFRNDDPNEVLQMDSVWITGQDAEVVRISRSLEDIQNSVFTKQGCYKVMGQHYFYNMTSTTECNSRGQYPWFLMADSSGLIGITFATIGNYPALEGRDWLDTRGGPQVLRIIVTDGPPCFFELDFLSIHIYFKSDPWKIDCNAL